MCSVMSMKITEASAESQYAKYKDLKKEDVERILGWLKMQPHLPPMKDVEVMGFLHSCYYSCEATKKCIDNFFTTRAHAPEFFANMDPRGKDIESAARAACMGVMPNLTDEGYAVMYARLTNIDPSAFVFDNFIKVFHITASLHIRQHGLLNGHIMVIDFHGGTFSHLAKVPISSLKKMFFYVQESIPVRLKAIHFINPVNFLDKVMILVKPFMKKELYDILHVHQNTSVFDYIPKNCLPNESGGTLGPIAEVQASIIEHMKSNAQLAIDEEKWIADESKRPGKPKNAGELFGVEGTFKKLDID